MARESKPRRKWKHRELDEPIRIEAGADVVEAVTAERLRKLVLLADHYGLADWYGAPIFDAKTGWSLLQISLLAMCLASDTVEGFKFKVKGRVGAPKEWPADVLFSALVGKEFSRLKGERVTNVEIAKDVASREVEGIHQTLSPRAKRKEIEKLSRQWQNRLASGSETFKALAKEYARFLYDGGRLGLNDLPAAWNAYKAHVNKGGAPGFAEFLKLQNHKNSSAN